MRPALISILGATLMAAGAAEAHPGHARYNAAAHHGRGHAPVEVAPSYWSQSRSQSWYSDTGWQPGLSAVRSYGYGYGYGGVAAHPPVVVPAPHYTPQAYGPAYVRVERSQPFGYVVDGYGRYPWNRHAVYGYGPGQPSGQGHACNCHPAPQPVHYTAPPVHVSQPPVYVQSPPVYVEGAQVHVQAPPIHVAPPQVEVAPPQIHYDQGYFAVPPQTPSPPPPPPVGRPYLQEPGERG